jgi:membrane protease YdiL (CAAX protease family)
MSEPTQLKEAGGLKEVFIHPEEKRLRSGWRLLINFFLFLFLSVIFTIPALVIIFINDDWFNIALIIASGIPIVLSVIISRKLIDRRSIRSLGLQLSLQAVADVLVGILISAAQLALVFVIEHAMGWLTFQGFGWQEIGWLPTIGGVLLWLVLFAAVGFYEELLSRGYQLQNLEEGLNTFWAVVLSAGFFGLLHVSNPGASWVSTLGIALAGAFYGFGYLRTRTLWLVIGMHFGWNFVLGPVLGFPVSGMATAQILVQTVTGPEIWTGGAFGPEAGLVVLPAFALGVLMVWLYTRGRSGKNKQTESL